MRIDCPSCDAAYDVPAERLAANRAVKCARCGGTWTPVMDTPAPPSRDIGPVVVDPPPLENAPETVVPSPETPVTPPAVQPVSPPPDDALPAASPLRRRRAPLAAAWLLSLAVIAALAWLVIDRRAAIMVAWPPSARVYGALGLTANR